MHPIARKRLRGGFIGPLVTGVLSAIAPNLFDKLFGRGKKAKGKRRGCGRISRRRAKAYGELINSGPLP